MSFTFDERKVADEAPKNHFFLVCGQIVFCKDEPEALPVMMLVNAVVKSSDGRLAVPHVHQAQQAIQMKFHSHMQDPTLRVMDCVIMNFMPLGIFTNAEFYAAPAGTKMVVKTTEDTVGETQGNA